MSSLLRLCRTSFSVFYEVFYVFRPFVRRFNISQLEFNLKKCSFDLFSKRAGKFIGAGLSSAGLVSSLVWCYSSGLGKKLFHYCTF